MGTIKGGIEGEFTGRVYPLVIGLKEGPRRLHLCGAGTTWAFEGTNLVVKEPSGDGKVNTLHVPLGNMAFVAERMFLVDPVKPEE